MKNVKQHMHIWPGARGPVSVPPGAPLRAICYPVGHREVVTYNVVSAARQTIECKGGRGRPRLVKGRGDGLDPEAEQPEHEAEDADQQAACRRPRPALDHTLGMGRARREPWTGRSRWGPCYHREPLALESFGPLAL
jgi:hypothetical protein